MVVELSGDLAGLVGLGLPHDLRHVWRAELEGVVFGFRHHVELFAERGLTVRRIFTADGGAASDLWPQITADVLQRPVTRTDRHPGSSLGAAFVAGMGAGLLRDWSDVRLYVAAGRQFQPDASAISIVDQKYEMWREIYSRLQTMLLRLSTIQQVRRGTV
jgi:xylulokinase